MTRDRKSTTTFASYRLFELLKYMSDNAVTMEEIRDFLQQIDPEHRKYAQITVYKYFNSFKALGITFKKVDNKFFLQKLPFSFDFSNDDIRAIKVLSFCAELMAEKSVKENFQDLIQKLEPKINAEQRKYYDNIKLENQHLYSTISESEKALISKFEDLAKENLKVNVKYKENNDTIKSIIVELIEITYKENKIYFKLYDPLKGKIISLEIKKIISLEQTPQKARGMYNPTTVTYTIKDELKKSYILKESEHLSTTTENTSTIVNKGEDENELIRRLISYCDLCKIESPKTYKDAIITELDAMLANYEKIN